MDYYLNYPQSKAVFSIAISIICYYCYYFLTKSTLFDSYFSDSLSNLKKVLFTKITGLIFFALLPGVLYFSIWNIEIHEFGVSISKISKNWYWLLGLPLVIFIINFFTSQNPGIYKSYPQIKLKNWTYKTFILSASGWIIYLFGYEFLFRGVLLLSCAEAFGTWPAIAINVSIYSAIHLTNGMRETIGAIPFGFIACFLMLSTGSILIPVIMHISLSVSIELFAIRNNPDIQFNKKRNQ